MLTPIFTLNILDLRIARGCRSTGTRLGTRQPFPEPRFDEQQYLILKGLHLRRNTTSSPMTGSRT